MKTCPNYFWPQSCKGCGTDPLTRPTVWLFLEMKLFWLFRASNTSFSCTSLTKSCCVWSEASLLDQLSSDPGELTKETWPLCTYASQHLQTPTSGTKPLVLSCTGLRISCAQMSKSELPTALFPGKVTKLRAFQWHPWRCQGAQAGGQVLMTLTHVPRPKAQTTPAVLWRIS